MESGGEKWKFGWVRNKSRSNFRPRNCVTSVGIGGGGMVYGIGEAGLLPTVCDIRKWVGF